MLVSGGSGSDACTLNSNGDETALTRYHTDTGPGRSIPNTSAGNCRVTVCDLVYVCVVCLLYDPLMVEVGVI